MEVKDILKKQPFTRGMSYNFSTVSYDTNVGEMATVSLPLITYKTVSQDQFLKELDPSSHDIHDDQNVPSIVAKIGKGQNSSYVEIKDIRLALAYQQMIVEKQTLYLCGKNTIFTLSNPTPSTVQKQLFADIKANWLTKNMEQKKALLIQLQKSVGDSAVIHYITDSKEYSSKVISYKDGYVLLPHYNKYGKMEYFGVYYQQDPKIQRLDVYDKDYMISYILTSDSDAEWIQDGERKLHGFNEIPVTYIRGDVAWNKAQSLIEVREILYNIYNVIMKRHGWGMLYIKGNVDTKMKKIAGSVILQDTSPDGNGSAEYKAPPTPEGMQNLLSDLHKQIQMMSNTVFLLPEDIKVGGDISGAAMKTMMSSAYEKALLDAIYYDDALDSLIRLFIYGYGIEKSKTAEVSQLVIRADFDIWFPQSDSDIITNIATLRDRKVISTITATEMSPYSAHDEYNRLISELKDDRDFQDKLAQYNGVSVKKASSTGLIKPKPQENI